MYYALYQMYVNGPTSVGSDSFSNVNFATGVAWDPFSSTSLGGKGYFHVCTPFTANTYTDFFINAWQVPNPQLQVPPLLRCISIVDLDIIMEDLEHWIM